MTARGRLVSVSACACLTLFVLLGAGLPGEANAVGIGTDRPTARAAPTPARSFQGVPTGCVLPDPTGTGGCVTATLAWLISEVRVRFEDLPVGCWDRHEWNPRSDHPRGRACDFTIGAIGTFPGPDLVAEGWTLARWLRANAAALQVSYVIFQGRIWSVEHQGEGWRRYAGGGVYDPTDVTGGHYDHLHVSTLT